MNDDKDKFYEIFKIYLLSALKDFLDREIDIDFVKDNFNYHEVGEEKLITLNISMVCGKFFGPIFKDVSLSLCILISNAKMECYLQSLSHEERNLIYTDHELEKNGLKEKFDQVYTCYDAIMQTTTVL